ncbi:MAG: nucleotidyltransferase [candidate division KSB1 bacterium]|nr:nucleotidyltransferase [candidate division KSB1 bacterium]
MLHAAVLLTALSKAEVAFIVIGGMAAVAQGATYVTADLDLCYQRHPQNYQRLSQALHPFHPRLRGAPADLPFVLDAATLRAGLNFTLMTDVGDVDLLGEVTGLGSYEAVKAHAEEVELYEHRIWVLTLRGLIVSKQAAGRAKDLRLLPELQALHMLREAPPEEGP